MRHVTQKFEHIQPVLHAVTIPVEQASTAGEVTISAVDVDDDGGDRGFTRTNVAMSAGARAHLVSSRAWPLCVPCGGGGQ